jgi:[FeFe] hydrogenase H-cluster maturation GTPase HydF
MPQDKEAPKGRLILPQVQILRELLDRGCVPHSCTHESLPDAMKSLAGKPDLVITDSQVFGLVNATIPRDWALTSFSVLLAAAKGDLRAFVAGAEAIDTLRPGARVLIAEACTHVPDTEDIGRVKIPNMLRKRIGELSVDIAAGNNFPEDLTPYSLIIHCGACVANARLVRSRIRKAAAAGVPITNYGLAIAYLQGILPRISLP